MTHEQIRPYVEAGLVSARPHDGLVIYNYTDRCTYAREWNDVTRACRGLIMREDANVIVARAFDKFFNHGEPDAPTPTRPPDWVSEKRDGSLAISYVWRGKVRWSTRGSMTSPQAAIAQRVWDANHAHVIIPEGWTLLCEVESPEIQSIVRATEDALVVLSLRHIESGREVAGPTARAWAERWGFPDAECRQFSLAECVERAKTLPADHEGWVLRWDDGDVTTRLKVKGREYLNVARMMQALGGRGACDAWYFGRSDLLVQVPEELRGEVETVWLEMDADLDTLRSQAASLRGEVAGMARKDAVAHVGVKHPAFPMVMQMLDGKQPDFKGAVYKARTGHRFARPNFETATGEDE